MALPVSDSWSQTSGSPQAITTYNPNWIVQVGALVVPNAGSLIYPTSGGYNTAYWSGDVFAADQYAQTVVTASQRSDHIFGGPAARCQPGEDTSYHLDTDGSETYISGDRSGSPFLSLATGVSFASNDVCRITVEGVGATVTIKIWKALAASPTSFTEVYSYPDTSGSRITVAGHAGIFAYGNAFSGPGLWTAGNLSAPATPSLLMKSQSARYTPLLGF